MNILYAYAVVALILLVLSANIVRPPKWKNLPPRHVAFLRFGCFLGFCMLLANILFKLF